MKRALSLVLFALAWSMANAQDKGKAEFTPSAEYRPRYLYMQNPAGTKGNDSFAEHRFKMGAHYKANEKFSAHATLLHAADFGSTSNNVGQTNNTEANANFDTGNEENLLNVNEAYMNWMFSDDMSFRIGRQNFQIADGTVFGYNDWEQNPGAFDGVTGVWEAEFGRFTGMVFNYREEVTGTFAPADAKHTAYGLSFDLKSMPDWMKMTNLHVIKDNADAVEGATGTTVNANNGQDILRYGAGVGFDFGMIDLKAHYAAQSGSYKNIATGTGAKSSLDAKGMMYQAELGLKLEAFMLSRLYVLYHVDSGDKNATDKSAGTYDPYFYEQHGNAGLMDLLGWGNLTQMTIGWTVKPGDSTDAGITYNMFSRTESGAGAAGPNTGRFGSALGSVGGTGSKLGDEIDLWAEHRYEGGLSTLLRLGYFMTGDFYEKATPKKGEDIMQVAVEGKLTF